MSASAIVGPSPMRRWRWALYISMPLAALAGTCWWLTAPLEEPEPVQAALADASAAASALAKNSERSADRSRPAAWPSGKLDGPPAKALLLAVLEDVQARLDRVECYTATFRKQERLRGVLGSEQTLSMKVRHRPFAVYFKFLAPNPGKEVVYAEGHHDNKVIAHSTGVSRFLVPRLAVAPDHPLALADSRHAITEAGLSNLTERLIGFRKMDLDDDDAVTVLDRTSGPDSREWLRSVHLHTERSSARPFARVEVLYDPETRFPVRISSYDWPEPGHSGDLLLAECYSYDDLNLDADLSALDFDPANPEYAFHRF
jgi:hypothetical protein